MNLAWLYNGHRTAAPVWVNVSSIKPFPRQGGFDWALCEQHGVTALSFRPPYSMLALNKFGLVLPAGTTTCMRQQQQQPAAGAGAGARAGRTASKIDTYSSNVIVAAMSADKASKHDVT